MISYLRHFLFFLLFLIPSYLLLLLIWGNIPYSNIGANFLYWQGAYGHLNTRLKEIPKYGEVDILFVGSSRVYRGFDPRIFEAKGFKTFVLGSSSQTPLQSYILLERYLDTLKPELIVFDVLPSSFTIKGIEPGLDLIANDKIDYLNLNMALELNDLMVWNTLLYAYTYQVLGWHRQFNEPIYKPEDKDTYIPGGYVHKLNAYYKSVNCDLATPISWRKPLEIQLEYLDMIRAMVESKDIKLQLINMPLADYECYDNNDIIEKNILKGAGFIDFNKQLDFNDSLDFYDEFHLNEKGVKKLNDYYLSILLN